MTLTDFLPARIAEDRRAANVGLEHGEPSAGTYGAWGHDRVLAECEAKRRIVVMGWATEDLRDLTAVLALPYCDHPDYREEWRP